MRFHWKQGIFNTMRPRHHGRPFFRWHFHQMHFLERNSSLYFDTHFIGMCCPDASICSDSALVPTRRQAIIWTNNGLVYRRIYASLSLHKFKYLTRTYENSFDYLPLCLWDMLYKHHLIRREHDDIRHDYLLIQCVAFSARASFMYEFRHNTCQKSLRIV